MSKLPEKIDSWPIDEVFGVHEDTLSVEMKYPKISPHKFVEVGLIDVRAADGIRISYDYDRDGWKIEQAGRFRWKSEEDEREVGNDWKEVAFVEAWARLDMSDPELYSDYERDDS